MKGWEAKSLGEVCAFINRGVSPKYLDEGGVAVLNQRCVRDHAIDYSLARRHDITAKTIATDRFVKKGDVLVNSTGVGTLRARGSATKRTRRANNRRLAHHYSPTKTRDV